MGLSSPARATSRLTKKQYGARLPALREELIQLQVQLKDAPFTVVLIVAGVAGSGRGDLLNTLGEWLDPRGVETFAIQSPSQEEREHPLMWRYWRNLPVRGRIGVFASSWYTETLHEQLHGGVKAREELDHELRRIRHFEKLLADDGTLIIKLWLNLSRKDQRARLKALEADPDKAWRVTEEDWLAHQRYTPLERTAQRIRTETDRPGARWTVIDALDERARNLRVGEIILRQFRAHLRKAGRKGAATGRPERSPRALAPSGVRWLRATPLDQRLTEEEYERKREKWLGRLYRSLRIAYEARRPVIFVFEGWDAAGKGGAIRRLASAIDVRFYRVVPIAKPTDEEKAHHYLWRFWRQVPRDGYVTIFDRSWYGRVLVERLEGFARPDEWRRAFGEISDFEEQLAEHGTIVLKFWMHISRDEQLRRFRAREDTAYKQHKINAEDWRNRRKWEAYEVAVGDMLALTDHPFARWHLVPANNKRHARLEILRTSCKVIEAALESGA